MFGGSREGVPGRGQARGQRCRGSGGAEGRSRDLSVLIKSPDFASGLRSDVNFRMFI